MKLATILENTEVISTVTVELQKLLNWVDDFAAADPEYNHTLELTAIKQEATALINTLNHMQTRL